MAKVNKYKAFDLIFESEIVLPYIPEATGKTDVLIKEGNVPDNLPHPVEKGVAFEIAPNEFLLTVPDIARFYISNGDHILFQRLNDVPDHEVIAFLLGIIMAPLMQQRQHLTLHASAVLYQGKALLFMGNSGVGKSTLASAFYNEGATFITDDLGVIAFSNDGRAKLLPSFPLMKLWQDILDKNHILERKKVIFRSGVNKYYIPVQESFPDEPVEIGAVFALTTGNEEDIEIEKIQGVEKFNILKNYTFRMRFIKGLGFKNMHFSSCGRMATQCDVYRIKRPKKLKDPGLLVKAITQKTRYHESG
jgi:hypothetical protein